MVDLIKRMIKHDPKERVDINEVFHHPAFWNSRKKIEYLLVRAGKSETTCSRRTIIMLIQKKC